MSAETRQKLVDDPRLVTDESQKSDLLDPAKTNTWLIEFLMRLLDTAGHPILVTALYTDHGPGTYHHPSDGTTPGQAVDWWIADWATVGDDKIVDAMQAAGAIGREGQPTLIEVGLSGTAAQYQTYVTWPEGCEVFIEDTAEHVHTATGVPT